MCRVWKNLRVIIIEGVLFAALTAYLSSQREKVEKAITTYAITNMS